MEGLFPSVNKEPSRIILNKCGAMDADCGSNGNDLILDMIEIHYQTLASRFMTNPFAYEGAEAWRMVRIQIAPMVYRSDLFILTEEEITQFIRFHLRLLGKDVPLRSKVTLH